MKLCRTAFLVAGLAGAGLAPAAHALTVTEQNEMVAAHNRWRREVGVPEVTWSAGLATRAQGWAQHLRQQQCRMAHSSARDAGENLYWASPLRAASGANRLQHVSPTRVTDAWGSEQQHYQHADNRCAAGKVCGHYTQVVWRSTTQIGCARAVCGDHSQVWVCHYAPPGNWVGQKPF